MALQQTTQASPFAGLSRLSKHTDIVVSAAAVLVIGMMVVPLPPMLLDLLLTINIGGALMIMLVTLYTTKPLQFSSFPSLLLLATLFRLALNISSTRLILLHAHAGAIIAAFGNFVIGGNYVVGLVIFLLLVVVQFMVITHGAGRVAEVSARFTLDAMPGKQMAIDADLSAGIIDEETARERRVTVAREADFYGAMDGASKFVRGDAMAAIIMIVVNIVGGIIVGVLQKQMDIMTAVQTYTLLTVGEGLVAQIPALLISTASGLVVTRTGSDNNLGTDMAGEMLSQPRAAMLGSGVLVVMGLIPGLPKIPFFLMAGALGYLAYSLTEADKKKKNAPPAPESQQQEVKGPEDMTPLLGVDPLEVEIGYGLIMLADTKQGGELLERITLLRKQVAGDLGVIVPAVRVRDNVMLQPNDYCIKLKGVEIAKGEVYPGQALAMNSGMATVKLAGTETVEPAFGLPAIWIPEPMRVEAEIGGYTLVDPLTVLITHLGEVIRKHAHEILSRQDMQGLIDAAKAQSPAVVDELIPNQMSMGEVQKVIQNLLRERVSIRDLASILETLADHCRLTKDTDTLSEYVRQGMARGLSRNSATDGTVYAFTLHPKLENTIADSIRQTEIGGFAVLDPPTMNRILEGTKAQIERMTALGYPPVCLCSPRVRLYYRRLVERMCPQLTVLSYAEIATGIQVESTGMVSVE